VSLLVAACLYIVFFAVVGYGFGQLFFGDFSWAATVGALSALGAVAGGSLCDGWKHCRILVAALCALSIACVGIEAIQFYRYFDIPGNYFGWAMRIAFILCLFALAAASLFGHLRHRPQSLGDSVPASPQLPPGFPLPPIDANGDPLMAGVLVDIQSIPASLTHDLPEAEVVALRALEGSSQRILRFDDHGFAWFGDDNSSGWFCLRPEELRLSRQESQA
jgi:hypothetical protein